MNSAKIPVPATVKFVCQKAFDSTVFVPISTTFSR